MEENPASERDGLTEIPGPPHRPRVAGKTLTGGTGQQGRSLQTIAMDHSQQRRRPMPATSIDKLKSKSSAAHVMVRKLVAKCPATTRVGRGSVSRSDPFC